MKKTKLLFSLLMAIVMMAMSPAKAWADDLPSLSVGDNVSITINTEGMDEESFGNNLDASNYNLYKFVATEKGILTVAASGEGDSYGALFDADANERLTYDDDSNENGDFKYAYPVTAGETYYIGLRPWNYGDELTDFTITIQYEKGLSLDENTIEIEADNMKRVYFVPYESGTYYIYPTSNLLSYNRLFVTNSDGALVNIPHTLNSDKRSDYSLDDDVFFLVTNLKADELCTLEINNYSDEENVNCQLYVVKADNAWKETILFDPMISVSDGVNSVYQNSNNVYVTLKDSDDPVHDEVEIGTEMTLHAEQIDGLTFDHWSINNECASSENEYDFIVGVNHFEIQILAVYNIDDDGKKLIGINTGDGIATCQDNSFILAAEGDEVTVSYEPYGGYKFNGNVTYLYVNSEEEEVSDVLDIANNEEEHQFTFIIPSGIRSIFVDFDFDYEGDEPEEIALDRIEYNNEFYSPVLNVTEVEEGVYTGTIYIESNMYDDLDITCVFGTGWSYWNSEMTAEDKLTVTINSEDQSKVYNLSMVKGRQFTIVYNPIRSSLNLEEDKYVTLSNSSDQISIFIKEGDECEVTVESTIEGDYIFDNWYGWDGEHDEVTVTEPTITLNATDDIPSSWSATFTSENYANIGIYVAPSSNCYAWVTDSDGKKVYDSDGYSVFDEDGNPDYESSMYYRFDAVKGNTYTLHVQEFDDDLSFYNWQDNDGNTMSGKEVEITINGDNDYTACYKHILTTTNGWTSYCDGTCNYTVEGGKAYKAQYQPAEGDEPASVILTSINGVIDWSEGVLISSEGEDEVSIVYSSWGADYVVNNALYGNYFIGEDSDMSLEDLRDEGKTIYGLYNKEADKVGFKEYTGNVLPAHKAVLMVDGAPSDAPLRVIVDDEVVGIVKVNSNKSVTDAIFDLMGRRVNRQNAKGMVIENGKVVLYRK